MCLFCSLVILKADTDKIWRNTVVQKRLFVHKILFVRNFGGGFVRNFGWVFAILFEVLLIEIPEEIHHFAGWEGGGGLRGTKIVNKHFVNKLAFPKFFFLIRTLTSCFEREIKTFLDSFQANFRKLEKAGTVDFKNTPHGSWGQGLGSVDPRFPAGLPFPVPEILEFVAFRDSGKSFRQFSWDLPGVFLGNPRTDPGNSHSLLQFSESFTSD